MKFLRYWLPVILWMCLIFGASSDTKSVQHTDGMLVRLLRFLHIELTTTQLEATRFVVRKGAHMTEYAVLALLLWRALRARTVSPDWSAKTAAIVLGICVAYATTDEVHQSFVKTRSASPTDVLIDTLGALLALGAIAWFLRRCRAATAE
jgi:VanZ family protein